MKPQITDFTSNGVCSRCGQCCSALLPATDQEMQTLRDYIERNNIRPTVPAQKDVITLQCPLLQPASVIQPQAACKAYDVRPAICRVFRCDQTRQRTAAIFIQETGAVRPCDLQNMWSLFDLTGIKSNDRHIPWSQAPAVIVTTDEDKQYRFQVGKPVELKLIDTEPISGLVINIRPDGLDMLDNKTRKSVFITFSRISDIPSPSAKYTETRKENNHVHEHLSHGSTAGLSG